MNINMEKTLAKHVYRRADIKVTEEDTRMSEIKYENKCDFCERERRFKTRKGMLIHRVNC